MRLAGQLLETLLLGVVSAAGAYAGVRLMHELQDPYSDLRLRGAEVVERLREVTAR